MTSHDSKPQSSNDIVGLSSMATAILMYLATTRSHFTSINYQGPPEITKILHHWESSLPGTWTKAKQILYQAGGVCVSTCLNVQECTHAHIPRHPKNKNHVLLACHGKSLIAWPHFAFLALLPATLKSSLFPGHQAPLGLPGCTSYLHCLAGGSFIRPTFMGLLR